MTAIPKVIPFEVDHAAALIERVAKIDYPINNSPGWRQFDDFEFEPSRETWTREMNEVIGEAFAIADPPPCLRAVARCWLIPDPEQLIEDHVHEFCSAVADCRFHLHRDETVTVRWRMSFGEKEYARERPYSMDDAMQDWPWGEGDSEPPESMGLAMIPRESRW